MITNKGQSRLEERLTFLKRTIFPLEPYAMFVNDVSIPNFCGFSLRESKLSFRRSSLGKPAVIGLEQEPFFRVLSVFW